MIEQDYRGDRWIWVRGPRLAIALLVSVVIGGTVGYMAIEGWSAWDAFHAVMRAGDYLVVLGRPGNLRDLEIAAAADEVAAGPGEPQ